MKEKIVKIQGKNTAKEFEALKKALIKKNIVKQTDIDAEK